MATDRLSDYWIGFRPHPDPNRGGECHVGAPSVPSDRKQAEFLPADPEGAIRLGLIFIDLDFSAPLLFIGDCG
jgi:hypothetical protein